MSPPMSAGDRMIRLLSVIPWVARHSDGAPIEEVVTRFDYPRGQLLRDLTEVLFFVGVHPFTPDVLIEVEIVEDQVLIRYADWFSRPLRLTSIEAARLLTVGKSVLELVRLADEPQIMGGLGGPDGESGPLVSALTKLGAAIGERADHVLDVHMGSAPGRILELLRRAIAERQRVELDYYSFGRDEFNVRCVDPYHVFNDGGYWYLSGWCHRAGDERVFRVDRIRDATGSDVTFEGPSGEYVGLSERSAFRPSEDYPRVRLHLDPSARWVLEYFPVEEIEETGDGFDVTIAVGAVAWLERLLLRLGPAAEILRIDGDLPADMGSVAASRVLARYGK